MSTYSVHTALHVVYDTVKGAPQKITTLAQAYLNVNRIAIITALALSCLAMVASLVYGSLLSLSLALTVMAAGCFAYKINSDLIEKSQECKQLQKFITEEEKQKLEHLAEHERMQHSLKSALEIVEFCNQMVGKASEVSVKSEVTCLELENCREVLGVWLGEIRQILHREHEGEKSAERIISILENFSKGQHLELTTMLVQLRHVQQQIAGSSEIILDQKEMLQSLSKEIREKIQALHDIHLQLSSLHQTLIHKNGVVVQISPDSSPNPAEMV